MTDLISRSNAIEAVNMLDIFPPTKDAVARELMALPSAEAVTIHEDGTLEVKVPNAQKVGRVLVVDTDSHIGGGLFYTDDAVEVVRCKDCKHYSVEGETTRFGWCGYWNKPTDEMRYCSDGERRNNE